ncbi:MAG TPA: sulfotransferase domain-containing protein [Sphingomicrobium sp.]|jgi:hypothetical protein|nr:sulfotransferase domain-containing protein [Sphingomicrobium sp.]
MSSTKPNLFIVGAPKCGTTAWVHYLKSHPDVYFPDRKEPDYFNFDGSPRRRMSFEDYQKLYAGAGDCTVAGDGSIGYLRSKAAPGAIHEFNPDARILIFVREQEYCLPSWHNQLLYGGGENIADFATAWRLSGKRDKSNMNDVCWSPKVLDYKAAGFFAEPVRRYISTFGREQVMILHFRDWVRNPRAAYLAILDFLGLPDDGRADFPPVNEARHRRTYFFVNFVNNPPRFVRFVVKLAKMLTGRQSLGVAKRAFSMGSGAGYQGEIADDLRDEIRAYFREDNQRLEPMIWRPTNS